MRSIRLLAVATTVLVLGSACGGDDPPTGNENEAPVADFVPPTNCVAGAACNFTSTSTDDVGVTSYLWDFDAAGTAPNATTASATFTFAAEGTFPVTLTVGDVEGLTHSVTKNVNVAAAPVNNPPPTAGFNISCDDAGNCTFTSTSTDVAPGTIASYQWDFGDGTTATDQNPIHDYAPVTAPTDFTVTLIVTDNEGATDDESQVVTVSPPPAELCQTSGTVVTCTLDVALRSTIAISVTEVSCELAANRLNITQPRQQTVSFNLCLNDVGDSYVVRDAVGAPLVFEAGTPLVLEFRQGTADPEDPPLGSPAIRIEGSSPNWTLNLDDGGNPTGAGEPDFTDVVLAVTATAAP